MALWIWAGSYRHSLPISTPFLTATPQKLEQRGSSRPEKEQPMYLSHFALEQTLQSLLSYTLYHSSEPMYLCVLMKSKLRSRGVEWFALGYTWSKVEMEAQRAESSLCSPITWACLFCSPTLGLLKVCNSTHFLCIFFFIAALLAGGLLGTRQTVTCVSQRHSVFAVLSVWMARACWLLEMGNPIPLKGWPGLETSLSSVCIKGQSNSIKPPISTLFLTERAMPYVGNK